MKPTDETVRHSVHIEELPVTEEQLETFKELVECGMYDDVPEDERKPAPRYRLTLTPVDDEKQNDSVLFKKVNPAEIAAPKPRVELWKNKWLQGGLCVISSDVGAGKSRLARRVVDDITTNEAVLFISFENDEQLFTGLSNGRITPVVANAGGFLKLKSLARVELVVGEIRKIFPQEILSPNPSPQAERGFKILVLDSIDRLHFNSSQWAYFLEMVGELKRELGLSVLITASNRPRHTSKGIRITDTYKGAITMLYANSIIGLGLSQNDTQQRYVKTLKFPGMVCVSGTETVGEDYTIADSINEDKMLPPTAAEKRNQLRLTVERAYFEGYLPRFIAKELNLPVGYVKGLLRNVGPEDYQPEGN